MRFKEWCSSCDRSANCKERERCQAMWDIAQAVVVDELEPETDRLQAKIERLEGEVRQLNEVNAIAEREVVALATANEELRAIQTENRKLCR